MYKKKYSHMDKVDYYNRLSNTGNRLGSNILLEKVSDARGFLLGADYADAIARKGKKTDSYVEKLKRYPGREGKSFLRGFKSYFEDD